MSPANVEIVRRAYEAANRGDLDGVDSYIHPEVEFHTYAQSPEAGVYRGREAVRAYNESLFQHLDSIRFEVEEVVDSGDRVVVVTTQHAVPAGSRQEMSVQVAEVWVIRDGLLAERHSYPTRNEAFEAVGLSAESISPDNVEQARRAADAYSRRDVEALLEDLDPEVEWHAALPMLLGGEATVYRGHDGIRELFREIDDVIAEIHVEYSEIRDLGDRVVAIGRIRTRGKASGAETESPIATVSELRDGKAVRIQSYLDPEEALAAAGLRDRID